MTTMNDLLTERGPAANGAADPKPPAPPTEAEARAALEALREGERKACLAEIQDACQRHRCTLAWRETRVNGQLVGGEWVVVDV